MSYPCLELKAPEPHSASQSRTLSHDHQGGSLFTPQMSF